MANDNTTPPVPPTATADDLLKDHRRRTKAPDGIVVGSNEYWKWWRENNREKNRLYQRRAYLKRRVMSIASRNAIQTGTPIADQLKEIDEQLASLRQFDKDTATLDKSNATGEKRNPFIESEAQRVGVSYEEAAKFMASDKYTGEESWLEEMNRRFLDLVNKPPNPEHNGE